MTIDDTAGRGAADTPEILDDEAIGIDRPGLHAEAGELPLNEPFQSVLARNIERRSFLLGAAAAVPVLMTTTATFAPTEAEAAPRRLTFTPIAPSTADEIVVPEGYEHQVLIKWGDPLFADAPNFDKNNQTAEAQSRQFGYNCDFVGYFPLESSNRALLCVNHEYTTGSDMVRGYVPGASKAFADVEIAAHGGSVVEIERTGSVWRVVKSDTYNRRITGETLMRISGPASGEPLMKTSADPTGTKVLGMLNNCSGGKTPWGTWLTCEENFNQYFANNGSTADADIKAAHARYGVTEGATGRKWEAFYDRFDVTKEPNEPFRFGWVVEIDPYDPTFRPRKRTALGRAKHEAATTALAADGRVVVYTGDDQQFDYVYKFVSNGKYDPNNRRANFDLLDDGVLYVAKFRDNNKGVWIPLTLDHPKLKGKFSSQGELLIKTRLAADMVGATAMDRPEDCQPNPVNGRVYLTMTNNSRRTSVVADTGSALANPRVPNFGGHIIELTESHGDHGAADFRWEIFLLCGNPEIDLKTDEADLTPGLAANATFFAGYADASKLGKIASPDNIAFDNRGNLWITTDGQPGNADIGNPNDAMHVVPTSGAERGYLRQFLSGPKGCEICGPEFADDERTVFCAVQHPGEDGGYPNTISTWPTGSQLPRPAVVAVRRKDGGEIGV
ncbi:secreted PhoX family phosphatase [Methylopila capsulata]|uniref:Secreted PhoX family phosphatase n=1 Tax=Methylopila capsulata TaxID=61654 RepID=A0A9W6MRL5_9HYPH|nr:PhoX family phosphatase [Methylopila capsulata]MBM7850559.1 secreted PhoX family phosphatase [Methylopila capsulata]GLK55855.1 dTDP-glucose 4,6-dehydratase [Methylopila capsulata]